jgi:hypothetical protein
MIDINTILVLVAFLFFITIMIARWRQRRYEKKYWALPTHIRVKWAQINHSSSHFRRSGGFQMSKRVGRTPNTPRLLVENDIWSYRACESLKETLARYDFYLYRGFKPGGNGYMSVVVKRRSAYRSLKSLWQNSYEPESYILTFPPTAVLNLDKAVRDQLEYWGATTPRTLRVVT